MSPISSFAEHAVDLLSSVGPVKARAMFGGYGLSLNGVSIGLIAEDRIYLRTDDLTRPQFQAAGSGPFVYQSKNGPMTMASYYALPEDSVDDPDRAARWGRLAADAARRAEAAKAKKKASKPPAAKKKATAARAAAAPGRRKKQPAPAAARRAASKRR